MKRRISGVLGAAASLTLAAVVMPGSATATPSADQVPDAQQVTNHKSDDRRDPLEAKRRELKEKAVELVATGKRDVVDRGGSKAVRISDDKWVEYGTQETAQLLTFLVQFGDTVDPRFPTAPAGPGAGEIPEPGADDNSTYWKPGFDRQHYLDMFFNGMPEQDGESFKDIYNEMSSGRFDVEGDVSDWVTVPNNEASYGQTENNVDMTRFVGDSATAWYQAQKAAGMSDADVTAYLQQYDIWDRFDHDGDGDFSEPDGYIDHFQAIHAGEGEEAGAPEWAIWSHRWYVNPNRTQGPEGAKYGGVQIGNTGLWIRDYTTEPENGGLGVFAHEFGHDLGLPDYYDTKGGENGTGFWNLMSSGSWMSHGGDAIGTTPNHMGATEKLYLGWLDYAQVGAGRQADVKLGPSYHATSNAQAVLVNLPPGQEKIDVGGAASGTKYFYSGQGDNRTATVTSPAFTVPAGGQLTAKVNYDIEANWDYAYAEVSADGGKTFTPVHTNLSTSTNPNNQNDGEGITGASGGKWVDLTADLASYAGQSVQLRFRMFNDEASHGLGFKVDDIAVGTALTTGVEDGAPTWTKDGFLVVENGSYNKPYVHYYLAENRVYGGYDSTLKKGPYNFGWAVTKPNKVEHFPYQDGLLVWYANSLYSDNNTSEHPGGGEALPVDAHAKALEWSDGTVARNRIQSYDATFTLDQTDPISLHREAATAGGTQRTTLVQRAQNGVKVFDDTDPNAYYDASNPGGSVIVGGTGTTIRILTANATKGVMTVRVN
ncbi:M6 family metalloprotease domain-containing protein [Nocardioides sp. MAH-18]|uniref:M6 family metalloprotease domain-containing protein n=1 Tax=Nocardioides agri TaxID=2682843 RepID=A0A6L6XVI3_9ACTN|nr:MULTISPECIES: immune inhibitor A domain-containing protein [unclassified Nocardioides]MBA2955914.1 immune inhibitor A [Nocardioides sp. CGMCC 1.13656]MVQ50763.1 M6 family metalloprotease domain-containing protein [Nocardioides sp. MAH-18]